MQIKSHKDARGQHVLELEGVVDAPIRDVWTVLSDTQKLNQVVFDLPALDITGVGSKVMSARATVVGIDLEFDEHPWIYESPHRYKSLRQFTQGPLERLESTCVLDERGPEETHVHYSVALGAKSGPVGWAAEKAFAHTVEKGLEKLSALLESEAKSPHRLYVNPDAAAVRARVAPFVPALDKVAAPALVKRLVDFIAEGPDDEVARLRPYALAERWEVERADVLALCLHAVRAGLLQMRWDTLCPACRGAVHSSVELHNVAEAAQCPVCDRDVDVLPSSNVEAVFAPVADVRAARPGVFCLGSPSRMPHWLAQIVLAPGGSEVLQSTWGPGRYLVQSPGIAVRTLMDVGETGNDHINVTLEGARAGRGAALPAATPNVRAGRIALTLKNESDEPRRVQIVNDDVADLAATATHVVETPTWQALFGAAAA